MTRLVQDLETCAQYFGYWVRPNCGDFQPGIICGATFFDDDVYFEVGSEDVGENVSHLHLRGGPVKYEILHEATLEEMLTHVCPKVRAYGQQKQKLSSE